MSRWPIRRTWFYEEWLHDLVEADVTAGHEEAKAALLAEMGQEGAVGIDGLAGLGAQVREVS